MLRRLIWICVLLILPGCASRRPSAEVVAEAGRAEALVVQGCYRCLEEALAAFERLAATSHAPVGVGRSAFTTAVLMVVRARELGMPDRALLARAEALAPAGSGTAGLPPEAYLDALRLINGELNGFSPEERERRGRARRALWTTDGTAPPARTALEAATGTDAAAQYLALAIDCEDMRLRKTLDTARIVARYPVPLLRFRAGLCAATTEALVKSLAALREADPRWTDTFFFEGSREMSRYPAPDVGRAAELFAEAAAAFPESVAITLALANARNALSEYEAALALFDRVLAGESTHRDALLGRLLSLSYLNRHQDAIRTATQLIDHGMYHQGDAYYWRAWNRYRVHLLPPAWDDVTAATRLMVNTSVYTLAGFIAYARQQLDVAIERLAEAYRMDATNCEAVWTEALVHVDKEDWTPSSSRFATAVKCYAGAADLARLDIATARTADWSETLKARRIAAAQKRVDTAEHRQAQSAYNAAGSYARLGRKAEALSFLEMAAQHPLLEEQAAALKVSIDKLP